jgi:hypothetical protein
MVSNLAAQNVSQRTAKVVRIAGDARYTTGNNQWKPLHVGDVLRPGTVIQTGLDSGSYVDLVLGVGEGPLPTPTPMKTSLRSPSGAGGATTVNYQPIATQDFVRIWENSALGIDKLTSMDTGNGTITDTQLDLKAGRIFGTVKKMSTDSRYEIKLPNGVAGIRGTIYEITADGFTKVTQGAMVVAWVGPDGTPQTQEVKAGEQFDPRTPDVKPAPIPAADQTRMETAAAETQPQKGGQKAPSFYNYAPNPYVFYTYNLTVSPSGP